MFTVELDGKTVTINPADYPDEWDWYPLPDGPHGRRTVCGKHREVFGALGTCGGCVLEDNPECPPDIEVPAYWEPEPMPATVRDNLGMWWFDHTKPSGPGLRCRYHGSHFQIGRACGQCLDEDQPNDG